MSSLVVEVCRVEDVRNHPNADRMCVVKVKGWEVCSARNADTNTNEYVAGDKAVYFPPDSVLPPALAERYGIVKYATPVKNDDGSLKGYRIRVARLRTFPSYGFIAKPDNPDWEVGRDVAVELGVTKWEPPLDCTDGDAAADHPAFHRYFSLEHWRNFPEVLNPGERIVITEKIHGMSWRGGLVREPGADGRVELNWMVGSHEVRRKQYAVKTRKKKNEETGNWDATETYQVESQFWTGLSDPIKAMIRELAGADGSSEQWSDVVVFGELHGSGIQKGFNYGFENGRFAVRVFDITVNGQWLDVDAKRAACARHGVEMVPVLYDGPYNPETVESFVSGPTTLCPPNTPGHFAFREGVVITAATERQVRTEKKVFGRAALKVVSFEYLERKGGTEYH